MSSHLTESEVATAMAFRVMAEEHLAWVMAIERFVYHKGRTFPDIQSEIPRLLFALVLRPISSRNVRNQAYGQGMGRHTKDEVYEIGIKDIKAIATYLGDKPFFTGDKATEVDSALFGVLAQFLWASPGSPMEKAIKGK